MSQTRLDANQVIRTVFDDATQSLKVVGLDPIVSRLAANTDSIAIADVTNTNNLAINAAGQAPVLTNPAVVDTTTWLNAVAASADHTTTSVNVLSYRVVGVMANWASLDQTDATLQFQGSLDGTIWDNIGSPAAVNTASGHKSFSLVDEPYKLVQLIYTHGTNTTGTLTVKYILRA